MPARPAKWCSSRPAPFSSTAATTCVINKGITLRGAGPGKTTLAKTDGAKPFQSAVSAKSLAADRRRPVAVLIHRRPDGRGRLREPDCRRRQGRRTAVTVANAAGLLAGSDRAAGRGLRRRLATGPAGSRARSGRPRTGGSSGRSTIPPFPYVDDFARRCVPDDARHRRLVVLAAGPPHCRGQADRLRLRVDHHLHHAHSHLLPRTAMPPSFPATGGLTSRMPASRT